MVTLAGAIVGLVVGLTGMGGGALMTPILVLLFGVHPLAAVSSDLVASAVMKPVGAGVHLYRRTVHRGLVGWLSLGSVPAAFSGVFVLRAFGQGAAAENKIKLVMGTVMVAAAAAMLAKSALDRRRGLATGSDDEQQVQIQVRRLPTVLVGAVGGLMVGMTSVGSGTLIVVLLLALYPRIRGAQLVGTDLAQAVPLVAAASVGHLLFGDFQLGLTSSLLLGALPGVYIGARLSAGRAAAGIIRPALVGVLVLSGLRLLNVPTLWLGVVLAACVVAAAGAGGLAALRRRGVSADVANATASAGDNVASTEVSSSSEPLQGVGVVG
jgi:uncharacterized membrane protein YfcA